MDGRTVTAYTSLDSQTTDVHDRIPAPDSQGFFVGLLSRKKYPFCSNQYPDAEPEQLIHHIHDAVNRFAGNAEQFDDIIMLCFRYKG